MIKSLLLSLALFAGVSFASIPAQPVLAAPAAQPSTSSAAEAVKTDKSEKHAHKHEKRAKKHEHKKMDETAAPKQ